MHHRHEDELFFPALAARVGADKMHLGELASQHDALDAALQAVSDGLAAPGRQITALCAGAVETRRPAVSDAASARLRSQARRWQRPHHRQLPSAARGISGRWWVACIASCRDVIVLCEDDLAGYSGWP